MGCYYARTVCAAFYCPKSLALLSFLGFSHYQVTTFFPFFVLPIYVSLCFVSGICRHPSDTWHPIPQPPAGSKTHIPTPLARQTAPFVEKNYHRMNQHTSKYHFPDDSNNERLPSRFFCPCPSPPCLYPNAAFQAIRSDRLSPPGLRRQHRDTRTPVAVPKHTNSSIKLLFANTHLHCC